MHFKGLIHRDVKPQNIIMHLPIFNRKTVKDSVISIRETIWNKYSLLELEVKICDLGVTKHTVKGGLSEYVGSYLYQSPEQQIGAPYEFPTDVWSVGAILFELISTVNIKKCYFEVSGALFFGQMETDIYKRLREKVNEAVWAVPKSANFSL